jgi:hypothetical protein
MPVEQMEKPDGTMVTVRFVIITKREVLSWGSHGRIHRFYQHLLQNNFDMNLPISTKYAPSMQEYRYWQEVPDSPANEVVLVQAKPRRLISLEAD